MSISPVHTLYLIQIYLYICSDFLLFVVINNYSESKVLTKTFLGIDVKLLLICDFLGIKNRVLIIFVNFW